MTKLFTAQEEERRRIACDLHDDHCQRITAMILEISAMEKLVKVAMPSLIPRVSSFKARLSDILDDFRHLTHGEPAQLGGSHETRTAEIRCPLVSRCKSHLGSPWKFPQVGAEDRVGPCVRMASARKASETPDEIWQKNDRRHDYRDTGYQRAVAYRCGPRLTVRLSCAQLPTDAEPRQ